MDVKSALDNVLRITTYYFADRIGSRGRIGTIVGVPAEVCVTTYKCEEDESRMRGNCKAETMFTRDMLYGARLLYALIFVSLRMYV